MAKGTKNSPALYPQRTGYSVRAASDSIELTLYGEIMPRRPIDYETGEPIEGDFIVQDEILADLATAVKAGVKKVHLHINSLGGDAATALTVHNKIREYIGHGVSFFCTVDGFAASGGSLIMCACDDVSVYPASLVMIHKCIALMIGYYNADELRSAARSNDAYDKAQIAVYARKTAMSETVLSHMMSDTTYMSGAEAVQRGFADRVLDGEGLKIAACADGSGLTVGGRIVALSDDEWSALQEFGKRNTQFGIPLSPVTRAQKKPLMGQARQGRESAPPNSGDHNEDGNGTGNGCAAVGMPAAGSPVGSEDGPAAEGIYNTGRPGTAPEGNAGNGNAGNGNAGNGNAAENSMSAGEPADINQIKPKGENKGGEIRMAQNLGELRTENPELAAQVVSDVRAEMAGELENASASAARTERERLAAIDEIAHLFDAETVRAAKYGDTPMTAEQMAFAAAKKAAQAGGAFLNAMHADGKATEGVGAAQNTPEDPKAKTTAEKLEDARASVKALLGKGGKN